MRANPNSYQSPKIVHFDMGMQLLRGMNKLRKTGTPVLGSDYFIDALRNAGVAAYDLTVEPITKSSAGYNSFYYRLAARTVKRHRNLFCRRL
ncbi:MAG: hypothetical protein HY515_03715 [Candidatus Aenigmarchaeota archaeon]|nr:hypothetical protein [Candidatus Aenigmarchaeota archaeon]